MASQEGSKKDRFQDRKQARARKMSLREWENTPGEAAMDKGPGMKAGGTVRGMGAAKRGGRFSTS